MVHIKTEIPVNVQPQVYEQRVLLYYECKTMYHDYNSNDWVNTIILNPQESHICCTITPLVLKKIQVMEI